MRDPTLPDVGNGELPCCIGSAIDGPAGCTCWRPVHDREQQALQQGPANQRTKMCADCAFRTGSPERTGAAGYEHNSEEAIEDLVHSSGSFACHQGMRRIVAMAHPTGARFSRGPGDYAPPVTRAGAFKADGSPADLCAGLAAARRALAAEGADDAA